MRFPEELPHRGAEIRQDSPKGLTALQTASRQAAPFLLQPGQHIPTPLCWRRRERCLGTAAGSGPDALFLGSDLQTGSD